ncbi:MAG: HAMP domain-containing protein [Desulfobacterales bacterium]|nr:HAMP domain-containing protein [Desulfobacterales bacterium]
MRFPFYSLRAGSLSYLAFLLVSAMLLLNVTMVKFAERDLIQARIHSGDLVLRGLEQKIGHEIGKKNRKWIDLRSDLYFKREVTQLLQVGGFSGILMVDKKGMKVFSAGPWDKAENRAFSSCQKAAQTKKKGLDFYGRIWGVIWLNHERINISAPMVFEGHSMGAITIEARLNPLYKALRKSEKVILIYIFLNTIILVLIGGYLLSRAVIKPIQKLLRITEEFKEGEPFPTIEDSSPNEIGKLFRSLNMMLKRLEENKKDLKIHISSLEKANREISKAQNEIIKSEKLTSVGRLATGVAHEIGNPLGIILGYLELLKKGDLDIEERQDSLDRMESEVTRINQIIKQLLDFSRPVDGEQEQTRVQELLLDTINMLAPQPMMTNIQIKQDLGASVDTVLANANQLKQVFLNIIINAADAMGDENRPDNDISGNSLSIRTGNIHNSIELRFMDTGPGIPQDELDHIFDPFFTTKEPGKGTGLGLSVSYRIIEGLGGSIRAENTPEGGAAIIISMPLFSPNDNRRDK